MRKLRILSPADMTADVIRVLEDEPCVSGTGAHRGRGNPSHRRSCARRPAPEAVNDVVERLRSVGVHREER